MHFRDEGRVAPDWLRETFAGCTGALAVLPVLLTLGLLAFSPLGPAAPPVALLAAFLAAGIGGLVHVSLRRDRLPVSGLFVSHGADAGRAVHPVGGRPGLAPANPGGVQGIVALCGFSAHCRSSSRGSGWPAWCVWGRSPCGPAS
jgi:hypothetical protein